jgi:hypothetical protein
VIAPSSKASANFGVAVSVAERSVVFDAAPSDVLAASAIVFSANDSTCRNDVTSPACWASSHARASRMATRPDEINAASAAESERTAAMRSTRSITPAISHTDNHREGVSQSCRGPI